MTISAFFDIDERVEIEEDLTLYNPSKNRLLKSKGDKGLTPFDFVNNIYSKVPWSSYSESEAKRFNIFIINKALSFVVEFVDLVSQLQKFVTIVPPEYTYRLYCELFNKPSGFRPWIKSKVKIEYSDELLEFLANHFSISSREVFLYIKSELLTKDQILKICKKYGLQEKELKELVS